MKSSRDTKKIAGSNQHEELMFWLKELLMVLGCRDYYSVAISGKGFVSVREKSSNPPTKFDKARIKSLMQMLMFHNILKFKDGEVLLVNGCHVPVSKITSYDLKMVRYYKYFPFLIAFLKEELFLANCHKHYGVGIENHELIVRERSKNLPGKSIRHAFDALMKAFKEKQLFNITKTTTKRYPNGSAVVVRCYIINKLNYQMLMLSLPVPMNDKTWALIPYEIKASWHALSSVLQNHVIRCCTPDAASYLDKVYKLRLFDHPDGSIASPISLENPSIPVCLPNLHLPDKMGNEVYDLVEVIKIKERDGENSLKRLDPMNRHSFLLREVLPAATVPSESNIAVFSKKNLT